MVPVKTAKEKRFKNAISSKYIGKILLDQGLITEEKLRFVLQMQQNQKKRPLLGELLVSLNYVDEDKIVEAFLKQHRVPFVPLEGYQFDPTNLNILDSDIAAALLAVPLDKVGHILTVAMANPLEVESLILNEGFAQLHILPCIARPSELREIISRYYYRDKDKINGN